MNIPEYVWVLLDKQASKYNITSSIYYFIALPTNRKTFCSLTVEHKSNVQDSTSRKKNHSNKRDIHAYSSILGIRHIQAYLEPCIMLSFSLTWVAVSLSLFIAQSDNIFTSYYPNEWNSIFQFYKLRSLQMCFQFLKWYAICYKTILIQIKQLLILKDWHLIRIPHY